VLAACGSYWFYLHCQNLVVYIQPLWSEVLMMMRQQLNF
ncbi:rhomboid family intramembrane serine protease, partial [bacterium LRH843]|nr:rhomboid family intramembrane serine protease [bacterium LRH843]